MEELNKNQLILLTLLISFVTSIATGIMTVSLLQEAPVEVTRNINRIVEKTIETVVPANPLAGEKTKEVTTIIVKEEDSVVDSINKNINSLVRIKEKDTVGVTTFYGIGLVISKDGSIVADRKTIVKDSVYIAVLEDNKEVTIIPTGIDKDTNIILFKAVIDSKNPVTFIPATFADNEPKLGQTLVSLGGEKENSISVGRVSLLVMKDQTVGTTTTKYLSSIDADVTAKNLVSGSPIFNLSGDIVGVNLSPVSSSLFTPISLIKKEIAILSEPIKEAPKTQ